MATPVKDVAPYDLVRGVYILCYVFLSGAADVYLESLKSDKDSKFWNHPYVVKAPRFRLVKTVSIPGSFWLPQNKWPRFIALLRNHLGGFFTRYW